VLTLCALVTTACTGAQAPPREVDAPLAGTAEAPAASEAPEVNLVGNRFRPLTWDEMTDEQKGMITSITSGPRRGGLGGPFNVLLRSPEMGDRAQALGSYIRFNESLSDGIREMAIIMTARHWTAHFEWYAHKNAALRAGVDPAIVDAIAAGRRPSGMSAEEEALYDFCDELLSTHRVSDTTFETATGAFGERGVVDIIGTVGYYSFVSMLLNVDEYPLPDGVRPELEPLAR
jgi:4-carboxymuconolactone decarboxylase